MSNQDILKALQKNRDVTNFAKFIGISTRGLYKLLQSPKPWSNQYSLFKKFVIAKYNKEL